MKIYRTNNTHEMGSFTISVYTWNINIKYVHKLRLIRAPPASRPNIYQMVLCHTPGQPEAFFDHLMCR